MTITEKILASHAGKKTVSPGETIWIDVDALMTHDVCGPGTISIFKREFGEKALVWDKNKLIIMPDHYIFTKDEHAIRNREVLRLFAIEQDLPNYYDENKEKYRGVCHIGLAEEGFCRPGEVMFGTDSHTCTAGAFGQFATGIGNTDAAFIMGTGKLWVKVPATRQFIFAGSVPDYIMAKDLILKIIGDIGTDGATYCTLEFTGEAVSMMSMDERMTLCNMAIEAGGKNGIIAADQKTISYVKARTKVDFSQPVSENNCTYLSTKTYKMDTFEPLVAEPFSPDKVTAARKLNGIKLDQCYIGSCTGGKLEDFQAAAKILKNGAVKIRTAIVPATRQVEAAIAKEKIEGISLRDIFLKAGADIAPPSCAACLGGPVDTFGRLNNDEVCISTTNRNFPGRMGTPGSKTYLASPLTAAASALTGRITDPRDYL